MMNVISITDTVGEIGMESMINVEDEIGMASMMNAVDDVILVISAAKMDAKYIMSCVSPLHM